ncbi:MAG: hypothetical protein RIQ33_2168 [Bacteroidota bacterium]
MNHRNYYAKPPIKIRILTYLLLSVFAYTCASEKQILKTFITKIAMTTTTTTQHTAHSTQHTAHSTQHTAHSTQHTKN